MGEGYELRDNVYGASAWSGVTLYEHIVFLLPLDSKEEIKLL